MKNGCVRRYARRPATNWWQWSVIALGTLILCSCRTVPDDLPENMFILGDSPAQESDDLEGDLLIDEGVPIVDARRGPEFHAPTSESRRPNLAPSRINLPSPSPAVCEVTKPDKPWGRPYDEYVCDGGDDYIPASVTRSRKLLGLEPSDTVVHFDTLLGETKTVGSSRACVYAPRFAATRKIARVMTSERTVGPGDLHDNLVPSGVADLARSGVVSQPLTPKRQVGTAIGHRLQAEQPGRLLEDMVTVEGFDQFLLPFENLQLVRNGVIDQTERLQLAESARAARMWTAIEDVAVIIDNKPALVQTGVGQPQDVVLYEMPPGKPQMRIVKLASAREALPGDEIRFTIRFDNLGDEVVGNVTIIDSLSPRLEYVLESQRCSANADFVTKENEVGSLRLRWEILDPMEAGEGGVIQFRCRVR